MRKWKLGVLAVLAIALVSIGQVRRDITGRTMQQVQTAAEARTAMARAGSLEKRVAALEARVAALEAKAAQSGQTQTAAKGQSPVAQPGVQRRASATVYVTQADSRRQIGVMYHRRNCRRLGKDPAIGDGRKDIVGISLDEAKQRGYTPCRLCRPPQ